MYWCLQGDCATDIDEPCFENKDEGDVCIGPGPEGCQFCKVYDENDEPLYEEDEGDHYHDLMVDREIQRQDDEDEAQMMGAYSEEHCWPREE